MATNCGGDVRIVKAQCSACGERLWAFALVAKRPKVEKCFAEIIIFYVSSFFKKNVSFSF